jgi:tRNA pseudouridine55 synthase
VAALKAFRPIAARPPEPPEWALPPGFPDPEARLRALHDGALVAMLREREGKLAGDPVLRSPL